MDPALSDYTDGIMFALAHDVEEAKEMILAHKDYVPEWEFERDPIVVDEPRGWAVYGGG